MGIPIALTPGHVPAPRCPAGWDAQEIVYKVLSGCRVTGLVQAWLAISSFPGSSEASGGRELWVAPSRGLGGSEDPTPGSRP